MVDQRNATAPTLIVIVISIVGLAMRRLVSGLDACLVALGDVMVGGVIRGGGTGGSHVGWGKARGHRGLSEVRSDDGDENWELQNQLSVVGARVRGVRSESAELLGRGCLLPQDKNKEEGAVW